MSIHLASVIACLRVLGSEVMSIGRALPGERDRHLHANAGRDDASTGVAHPFLYRLSHREARWRDWVRVVVSRVFDAVRGARPRRSAEEPSVDVVAASSGLKVVAARLPPGPRSRRGRRHLTGTG